MQRPATKRKAAKAEEAPAPLPSPDEAEVRRMLAADARNEARGVPVSVKADLAAQRLTIAPPHDDGRGWLIHLKDAVGTNSDDFTIRGRRVRRAIAGVFCLLAVHGGAASAQETRGGAAVPFTIAGDGNEREITIASEYSKLTFDRKYVSQNDGLSAGKRISAITIQALLPRGCYGPGRAPVLAG